MCGKSPQSEWRHAVGGGMCLFREYHYRPLGRHLQLGQGVLCQCLISSGGCRALVRTRQKQSQLPAAQRTFGVLYQPDSCCVYTPKDEINLTRLHHVETMFRIRRRLAGTSQHMAPRPYVSTYGVRAARALTKDLSSVIFN